jgi:uncharacterized protein YbaP (TraB family)
LFRLVLLLALIALPARAEPPVWVVRDADSTMVLFGSVHLLPPGLDWTPDVLDEALKSADDIWFELPIDADSTTQSAHLAIRQGMLPGGETLTARLSPVGRERLARLSAQMGVSFPAVDAMRPWLAEMTLVLTRLAQTGVDGSSGVEQTLSAAAPPTAKRRAFETAAEQIAFFAEAPEAEQIASLEDSMRVLEEEPEAFDELVQAWLDGDMKGLEEKGLDPLRKAAPGLYVRLITERNARWVDALARRLKGSGESVVVVGAGHLIGPDGLPAMLRARGIDVEGP